MKVYIILANGYEDGSLIEGVYQDLKDAKKAIRDLRRNMDPLDKEWLSYSIADEKVREAY